MIQSTNIGSLQATDKADANVAGKVMKVLNRNYLHMLTARVRKCVLLSGHSEQLTGGFGTKLLTQYFPDYKVHVRHTHNI